MQAVTTIIAGCCSDLMGMTLPRSTAAITARKISAKLEWETRWMCCARTNDTMLWRSWASFATARCLSALVGSIKLSKLNNTNSSSISSPHRHQHLQRNSWGKCIRKKETERITGGHPTTGHPITGHPIPTTAKAPTCLSIRWNTRVDTACSARPLDSFICISYHGLPISTIWVQSECSI